MQTNFRYSSLNSTSSKSLSYSIFSFFLRTGSKCSSVTKVITSGYSTLLFLPFLLLGRGQVSPGELLSLQFWHCMWELREDSSLLQRRAFPLNWFDGEHTLGWPFVNMMSSHALSTFLSKSFLIPTSHGGKWKCWEVKWLGKCPRLPNKEVEEFEFESG